MRKPDSSDYVSVALDIDANFQTLDDKWASSAPPDIAAAAAAGSALTVARTDHAHKVGSGTVLLPGLPVGEATTGLYRPGTGQLAAAIAGVSGWTLTSASLQLEQALSVKKISTPSNPASGYSALYPKSDERWRRLTSAGSEVPLADDQSVVGKNKLINPRFSVSERLFVAQTDNTWWIDGWRTLLEAANAATWSRDTADVPTGAKYAAKGVVGSGNNNKFALWQTIDSVEIQDLVANNASFAVSLKTTTGIANVKAALVGWTGTANATTGDPVSSWGADGVTPTLAANWAFINTPANLSVTTSWARYKVFENQSISNTYNNVAAMIWSDDKTTTQTTDILRVAEIQVESGAFCTPIEQRPWEVEAALALAQHADLGGTNGSIYLAHDVNGAARTLYLRVPSPVPMRATPSATVRGTWTIGIASGQPTASAVDRWSATLAIISSGAGYTFFQTVDATTYLSLDAGI